jgi:hypothetical protein
MTQAQAQESRKRAFNRHDYEETARRLEMRKRETELNPFQFITLKPRSAHRRLCAVSDKPWVHLSIERMSRDQTFDVLCAEAEVGPVTTKL